MTRRTLIIGVIAVCIFMYVAAAATMVRTTSGAVLDTVNKSNTAGLYWAATGKEEQQEEEASWSTNDEFDEGGFSSLDSMLQWAIGNSDPAKLREAAKEAESISDIDFNKQRQFQIKVQYLLLFLRPLLIYYCSSIYFEMFQELMEQLNTPSDAELMQIAIADLKNASVSSEDRRRALHELLILVEMIDNANKLEKLGGLAIVIQELINSDREIRLTSAWILGKASQNNPVVQKQVLEYGALTQLIKMVKSSSSEEATKALYAVSALIRNNIDGQQLFYAEEGGAMLQDLLSNSSVDIRLQKKLVFLVADLAECQLESKNKAEPLFLSNRLFLKSVVDLTTSTDLDLQEKALMAIKSLLQLNTTEALDFRDFCHLDEVLERMREQWQNLMTDEYQRDIVEEMEILRKEVESIFRRKLEKNMGVPT